jgi:hypothetical protein
VAQEEAVNAVAKFLYKPFGILVSLFGGMLAGALFKKAWKLVTKEDDAPDAMDEDRSWRQILAASAVQGAVFALTKAVLHRSGAKGVRRLTGTWPG